jgi:hypothetical protein
VGKPESVRLKERQAWIKSRLAEVPALQEEERRIGIALEVLASLPPDDESPSEPTVGIQGHAPSVIVRPYVPVKQLIVDELREARESLSREDVAARLALKASAKESTVASTLSNMVKDGLLKRDGGRYALLDAIAQAADMVGIERRTGADALKALQNEQSR